MQKILLTLSVALLFAPITISAHGGEVTDFEKVQTGFGMMRYIEDRALGNELHDEMEDLIVKMMASNMTEAEAERMVELMERYPGPHSMMVGRMVGMNIDTGLGRGWNMMPGDGFGGFWFWVMVLTFVAWLAVGIFVILYLWKQITKK